MEILECLQKDHDAIKEMMVELKTRESTFEGKRRNFLDLASLVESHAKAEEAVVLSWALTNTDDELRGLALESFEEHDLAEDLANSIRRTENEELWRAKVKVYCDLLEHHLEEAEHELFPELYERLDESERATMGRTYLRNRMVSDSIGRRSGGALTLLNEAGRVGLRLAWGLAVPAWLTMMAAFAFGF